MSKGGFKAWEVALLALGAFLFSASSVFYFGGISVRKHILGWQDEIKVERVGMLQQLKGTARRQINRESEFSSIKSGNEVYNLDTLVTGPESTARVQLDDGSFIDLSANTMVKLVFDSKLSLGGIARSASVEVVSGNVTGASKGRGIVLRSRGKQVTIARNTQQSIEIKPPPEAPVAKRRAPPVAPPPPIPVPPPVVLAPKVDPSPVASAIPSPLPSPAVPEEEALPPVLVQITAPKRGERLSVEKGSQVAEREVTLQWTIKPARAEFDVRLSKILGRAGAKKSETGAEVVRRRVSVAGTQGSFSTVLREPGQYRWEIRRQGADPKLAPLAQTEFILNRFFEGIETLSPLVGGQAIESSRTGSNVYRDFNITLRWKPWSGATRYRVRMTREAEDRKAILEGETDGDQFVVSKNKVYSGRIFYRISTDLPSGFVVNSESTPFIFNFLPPHLVMPSQNSEFSKKRLLMGNDSILMTWQKTSFTDSYELELAVDEDFTRPLVRQRVKENFFVLRAPPVGVYWWRVRSYAKDLGSPPSEAHKLTMAP